MKPLAFVTLTLVCTLPPTITAQQANANVVATVVENLTITSEGETSFGDVGNVAHTETIDPHEPTATQSTAEFTVSGGSENTLVVFSCPTEVTLSGPGTAAMTFTPSLAMNVAGGSQAQGAALVCPSHTHAGLPVSIWLGGDLNVIDGQATGTYTGVFTLSVAHQ